MHKLYYAIMIAICFLLSGCQQEESDKNLPDTGKKVTVIIPFQFVAAETATYKETATRGSFSNPDEGFRLEAGSSSPMTRSPRTISQFNNTWILAFATDGSCVECTDMGSIIPGSPLSTELPQGENMTLYILANGPSVMPRPASLANFESNAYFSTETYTDENTIPYIGKVSGVSVREEGRLLSADGNNIQIPLKRIASKLSITCDVSVPGYSITSVRLHNASPKMYYAYANTTGDVRTDAIEAGNVSGSNYTWYIGENLRGNGSSTNQSERYDGKAPASSTFIRITLRSAAKAESVDYDIYPGKNFTDNYDMVRNWDYIYTTTFSKTGSQLSSNKRVLVSGDLTETPSNSYIMLPGKSYKFNPRIKGEGQNETGGVNIPVTHEADEIRLTWQDTQSLIQSIGMTDDGRSVVVTASPGKTGNAVASAYSEGRIVWSWHLWIKSTKTDFYTTNGIGLMSSTLGALNWANDDSGGPNSLGLIYQWGRNVPFPAASAADANTIRPVYDIGNNIVLFTTHEGAETINEVIANPTVFYYSSVVGDSWHKDGTDLWGGNSGKKTIFDPSPKTWKIMHDHTAWNNWTNADDLYGGFGWKPDKLARLSSESGIRGYFPAAGFYTDTPGNQPALTRVGDEGRYWTAVFTGNQAGILRFTSKVDGSTDPDNDVVERVNVNQSFGCSVRPMKP